VGEPRRSSERESEAGAQASLKLGTDLVLQPLEAMVRAADYADRGVGGRQLVELEMYTMRRKVLNAKSGVRPHHRLHRMFTFS
jgi:hypothetical protein